MSFRRLTTSVSMGATRCPVSDPTVCYPLVKKAIFCHVSTRSCPLGVEPMVGSSWDAPLGAVDSMKTGGCADSTGSDLFLTAASLPSLRAAWEKVHANGGGPGDDGVTIDEFAFGLRERLGRLHAALVTGTYAPGPARVVYIPKPDGSSRRLTIPCIADRVVQTSVTSVLMPLIDRELEDTTFAYRPGRSIQMAISRISALRDEGYLWVVDGDIERYFENVPHPPLLERLRRYIRDPAVIALVQLWLQSYAPGGRGLPEGMPLSPLLSNLYLDDVDEAIHGHGIRLVRFADDFVLLCRSRARAEGARRRMAGLLAAHGLALNEEKTRIVPFEDGFRFLGHLFVRSLVLESPAATRATGAPAPRAAPRRPGAVRGRTALAGVVGAGRSGGSGKGMAQDADDYTVREEPSDLYPSVRVLYVYGVGRELRVRNESFSVVEDDSELVAIPPARLDRIEIGPGASVATSALRHALVRRIPLALVNGWGEELGVATAFGMGRNALHLAQARCVLDEKRRIGFAARIVEARIRNQRALLRRLNRRRKARDVDAAARGLGTCLAKINAAESVTALMGIEGRAAALYWPAFGRCLPPSWVFEHRRRRPPPDPVNLLLSFGSALLARDIAAMITRHGLHPGFGVLHACRDRRPACQSDLIEEFRAPLVEALVAYVLNNRVFRSDEFQRAEGRCRILPEAREKFVRQYERWVTRPILNRQTNRRVAWRYLVEQQVCAYARHVNGGGSYRAYWMDY